MLLDKKHPGKYTLKKLLWTENNSHVRACVEEINDVVSDAKPKLEELVKDYELEVSLPDLPTYLNKSIEQYPLNKIIAAATDPVVASFATSYLYRGYALFAVVMDYISTSFSALANGLMSHMGAIQLVGTAFILPDSSVRDITKAVARKELNEAIYAIVLFRHEVIVPIGRAAQGVQAMLQNVKDDIYRLNDIFVLDHGMVKELRHSSLASVEQQPRLVTIESAAFPGVYLRMSAENLTKPVDTGGGTVNCQFTADPFEQFRLAKKPEGTVSIESNKWRGAFLRIDGRFVSRSSSDGAGVVNAQFSAWEWEHWKIVPQEDDIVSFESAAFSNVYLRMNGQSVKKFTEKGGGIVNASFGVGPLGKFKIHYLI
ncbi:hypothetical protein BC936DRAFT_139505 [Jimgerdemannia flammicorona]|uniref:Uncharacterized protein n=1 Tax=Jimgerdemannia flammicorona TaxID=994334 RepID=A0A433B9S2_9FUNG|nr:hypothetical protein BC936DRAFT_139505 [Jimgerdemannia flammicorona]